MRATELMINDLVRTNKDEIIKVESISTKRQHRKVGYHKPADITHIKYVRQGQLEPILLTEEILELNGFVNRNYDNAGFQRLPDELANKHLTLYFEEGVFGVGFPDVSVDKELSVIRNIFYVHQLQQVLRLCGLNELADNFKVRRN